MDPNPFSAPPIYPDCLLFTQPPCFTPMPDGSETWQKLRITLNLQLHEDEIEKYLFLSN